MEKAFPYRKQRPPCGQKGVCMKYGFFDDRSCEYVITTPETPLPWINYLGCKDFFTLISNTCGGYSFYKDAKLLRPMTITDSIFISKTAQASGIRAGSPPRQSWTPTNAGTALATAASPEP